MRGNSKAAATQRIYAYLYKERECRVLFFPRTARSTEARAPILLGKAFNTQSCVELLLRQQQRQSRNSKAESCAAAAFCCGGDSCGRVNFSFQIKAPIKVCDEERGEFTSGRRAMQADKWPLPPHVVISTLERPSWVMPLHKRNKIWRAHCKSYIFQRSFTIPHLYSLSLSLSLSRT